MNLVIELPNDVDVSYLRAMQREKRLERKENPRNSWEDISYIPWEDIWWNITYGYKLEEEKQLGVAEMSKYLTKCFDKIEEETHRDTRATHVIHLFEYIHAHFDHFQKNFGKSTLPISLYQKTVEFTENDEKIDEYLYDKLKSISTDLMKKLINLFINRMKEIKEIKEITKE